MTMLICNFDYGDGDSETVAVLCRMGNNGVMQITDEAVGTECVAKLETRHRHRMAWYHFKKWLSRHTTP